MNECKEKKKTFPPRASERCKSKEHCSGAILIRTRLIPHFLRRTGFHKADRHFGFRFIQAKTKILFRYRYMNRTTGTGTFCQCLASSWNKLPSDPVDGSEMERMRETFA